VAPSSARPAEGLSGPSHPLEFRAEMRDDPGVRYTVEHFRAIEAADRPLGVAYIPTGRIDDVEAHDPPAAAAIALADRQDALDVDVVSYDPAEDLYGVTGEDEAVRVTAA
jgi:hypothetical protein